MWYGCSLRELGGGGVSQSCDHAHPLRWTPSFLESVTIAQRCPSADG